MKRLLFALLFFFGWCFSPSAQQYYHFNKLTVENGLNDNDIHVIGQDRFGMMWFGSMGGLNRFNGRTVKWFTHIPGDRSTPLGSLPQSMTLDSAGRFWIGFETGLMEFDHEKSAFRRVAAAGNARIDQLLSGRAGTIYMATDAGLGKFDTRTGKVLYYKEKSGHPQQRDWFNTRVFSLFLKGNRLYLTSRKGVFVFDIRTEILERIPVPELDGTLISSITVDEQDNIWLAASGNVQLLRLSRSAGQGFRTRTYQHFFSSSQQIISNNVNVLLRDGRKIWVATSVDGLVEYVADEDIFRRHMHQPSLPGSISGNLQRCIFRDREGLIWLGGNQGVNFFNPQKTLFSTIHPFDTELDLRHRKMARGATEDKAGDLWFATLDGVSRYSPTTRSYKEWRNVLAREPVIWNNSVRGIACDQKGDVWIATAGGVNRFRSGGSRMEFVPPEKLPAIFYFFISHDRDGRLWFCSRDRDGFYWYDHRTDSYHGISEHPDLKIFTGLGGRFFLEDSQGRYWLGLNGNGLGMYDPVTRRVQRWTTADPKPTIAGNMVIEIKEDRNGNIWVSTTSGITGFTPSGEPFRSFTGKNGLLSHTASALAVDRLNRLWVGTTRGISMIDSSRKVITGFGVKEGLPAATFFEHPSYESSNGDFIFPSVNGYVRFDPLQFRERDVRLPLYLTGVRVFADGQPFSGYICDVRQLRFTEEQQTFTLEFVALHYENPGRIWYAYRLDGFDKDWVYTRDFQAHYTNVPGGNYTFRLKATTDPLKWNVPEKTFGVFVKTVFYRTTWFLCLSVAVLLLLLYAVYRYRLRQQRELITLQGASQLLEKEKAMVMYESLKQQLNPHFLFNSLTSLRSLIRTQPARAGEFLDDLSRIFRYILKNREKETVPLSEELQFTETYIQLQKTRFAKGFFVKIEVPKLYLHRYIAPVTLQNLVENCIKHNQIDEDSPLRVKIFVEEPYLFVSNNVQRKEFVDTSNGQGLLHLQSLYTYLSERPVLITETRDFFTVGIPLL